MMIPKHNKFLGFVDRAHDDVLASAKEQEWRNRTPNIKIKKRQVQLPSLTSLCCVYLSESCTFGRRRMCKYNLLIESLETTDACTKINIFNPVLQKRITDFLTYR